jgi:signal transduction histidine kinase/ActR/RegA family two-component response regulator
LTPLLTIALNAEHDIVLARQRVRQVAEILGLDASAQTRLTTAVSEIARNAFQYGTGGKVEIRIERGNTPSVLWVRVMDRGPGLNDLDSVLSGVYRSSTGLGLGIVGARRLVDRFAIESQPGFTRVELGQELPGEVDDGKLHQMLDELGRIPPGNAFTEVLQQNQELLQTQEELAQANQDLAAAGLAKDRFLAMLSHELRNLLNALRSSLEVLQRDPEPAIRQRMQNLAIGQTEHLRRLVEDLLDVSQIHRGHLEVRAVPLDMAQEVGGLLTTWREKVAGTGLRLRIERPVAPLWTRADPTRLAQIVGNLLSNACKFTDPGGEIRVSLERRNGKVRLTVADTGCGMKAEALEKVFEPFTQTEEAQKRMTGGLGLGLSIVKGLVESHGGAMWAESDGPGLGSRFLVDLPATAPPAEGTAAFRVIEPEPADPLRILLVDDHEASVEGLAQLLRLEGHEVEVATDGPSALEQAPAFEPDIVLCDLGLPGMDGYEVARILRGGPQPGDFRLFAISGFADPGSKARALDAGFDDHLSKPINITELMRRLSAEEEAGG